MVASVARWCCGALVSVVLALAMLAPGGADALATSPVLALVVPVPGVADVLALVSPAGAPAAVVLVVIMA